MGVFSWSLSLIAYYWYIKSGFCKFILYRAPLLKVLIISRSFLVEFLESSICNIITLANGDNLTSFSITPLISFSCLNCSSTVIRYVSLSCWQLFYGEFLYLCSSGLLAYSFLLLLLCLYLVWILSHISIKEGV